MSNLSAESAKARPPSRAYTLGAAAAIGLSVMLGSVSAIAQTGTVDRGANRFDSVGIFGARTGLQLTRDNGTLAVDDPGVDGLFRLGLRCNHCIVRVLLVVVPEQERQESGKADQGDEGDGGHKKTPVAR